MVPSNAFSTSFYSPSTVHLSHLLLLTITRPACPFRLPLLTPLLFPNNSSDARDHCANERTYLSWLRLSIYMSVVSIAIIISFHLKNQPTAIEKKIALPVGLCFWGLSLACLISGAANYVNTVRKYRERRALVQSGWKTQVVSGLGFQWGR